MKRHSEQTTNKHPYLHHNINNALLQTLCRHKMKAPMEKWTKSTFYSATVNEVFNGKKD